MHDGFVFDGRHWAKAYLWKLKGVLMWQICLFEQIEILFLVKCLSRLMAIQHVLVPVYWWLDSILVAFYCFSHTFINIIVCFHETHTQRVCVHIYLRPKWPMRPNKYYYGSLILYVNNKTTLDIIEVALLYSILYIIF